MAYTFVTQFWVTEPINVYDKWIPNLVSDAPYIIFGNLDGINLAKKLRGDFQTYYIETTSREDIFSLLEEAVKFNPYHSSWFLWADASLCLYKDEGRKEASLPVFHTCDCDPQYCMYKHWKILANGQTIKMDIGPSLNIEKLQSLPTDKLICTHDFTMFMTHKDFFPNFVRLYKNKDIAHIRGLFPDLFQQCEGFETFIKYLQ